MFGLKKRLLADAVEIFVRAQEELPVTDCRGAVKLATVSINLVVGKQLELGTGARADYLYSDQGN